MASKPISVFFSYSRKDEALMRELERHLEPLRLSQLIESWHDGCITPGEEWEPRIKEKLETAQIILLLITVNFINSEYCNTVELSKAIERHKSGQAHVIPLILRPCVWKLIPVGGITLGKLQALPKNAKAVTRWEDRDEAFENIASGLLQKIEELQLKQEQAPTEEAYNLKLQRYKQELLFAVSAQYPLAQKAIDYLSQLEKQFSLKPIDVIALQKSILGAAEAKYQKRLGELAEKPELRGQTSELPSAQTDQGFLPLIAKPEPIHQISTPNLKQGEEQNARIAEPPAQAQYTPPPVESPPPDASLQQSEQLPLETVSAHQPIIENFAQNLQNISESSNSFYQVSISTSQAEDLNSEIFPGHVYKKLRDFLAIGQWHNADIETEKRLLDLVNRQNSFIRVEDIGKIPKRDLVNIDFLWTKYSNGRFGLSTQKRLWQQFEEPVRYGESWKRFGKRLGWRRQKTLAERGLSWLKKGDSLIEGYEWIVVDELQFDIFAPEGHLPVGPFKVGSIPHYQFLNSLSYKESHLSAMSP
jgi:hypothetical protein